MLRVGLVKYAKISWSISSPDMIILLMMAISQRSSLFAELRLGRCAINHLFRNRVHEMRSATKENLTYQHASIDFEANPYIPRKSLRVLPTAELL